MHVVLVSTTSGCLYVEQGQQTHVTLTLPVYCLARFVAVLGLRSKVMSNARA